MSEQTLIISPTFGTMSFDAVFRLDHGAHGTLTDHPVEVGAAITDHAYMEPFEFSMDIGMSDASALPGTIAGSSADRARTAYERLIEMMELFEPLTIISRLYYYDDMVIVGISASDSVETMTALKATLTLREIMTVEVSTIDIQQTSSGSKKKKKKKKNSGSSGGGKPSSSSTTSANGNSPNQSILYQLTH